jgi:hypothetical protein
LGEKAASSCYSWEVVNIPKGNPPLVGNPTSLIASASELAYGDYVFQLTLRDNEGNHANNTVTISIESTPTATPTLQPTNIPTPVPSFVPTLQPTTASCTDKVKDGEETGVDCGGVCHPCNVGDGCNTAKRLL